MARLISDEGEFFKRYRESESSDLLLKLTLTQDGAAKWKANGDFKHIRNQLRQVQGLEIACQTFVTSTGKHMCHYYFMCPTRDMMGRVFNMINEQLEHGNHIKLMDSLPEPPGLDSGYNYSTAMESSMNPSCTLL